MAVYSKLFLGAVIVMLATSSASAQTRSAGDTDDQFVITGCVMRSTNDVRAAGPHSMMVWSKGDMYLASPSTRVKPSEAARPVGTAGAPGTVFYWLDDEDDFARYAGQRVEIIGELSDEIDHAEIEMETEGGFTEVEFDAGGREAKARIPTSWFGPAVRGRDLEADIAFRTVDVEKVNPLGPCSDPLSMGLPKPRNLIIGVVIVLLVIAGGLLIAQDQETLRVRTELPASDAQFPEYLARLLGAPLTTGDCVHRPHRWRPRRFRRCSRRSSTPNIASASKPTSTRRARSAISSPTRWRPRRAAA